MSKIIERTFKYSFKLPICSKCIYDSNIPGIYFDASGMCNYCLQFENLKSEYATGRELGHSNFENILDKIRIDGKNSTYDCIIGVSGGTDSSYLVHMAKTEWNLRPLAIHYDNTWNSAIATSNIFKVLSSLDVDLYTHVVSNKEIDDIFISFLKAGVPEIEASTDLGFAQVLRNVAKKYNIKYVLEGHSYVEEGITPLSKNYFDGRYIRSIHQSFGNLQMSTYPLMTLTSFLNSTLFCNTKFIRPFWYLKYSKSTAMEILKSNYDWQYYGGHHLENKMTAFYHNIYMPEKFKSDLRINTLAAKVRNGEKNRDEAINEYLQIPEIDSHLLNYFCNRLQISKESLLEILGAKPKYWHEFPTYKKHFELLKPLFYVLMKQNKVTKSFYMKYCKVVKQ